MAEPATRRSALAGHVAPGVYGAETAGEPGVAIAERRPLSLVHVAVRADDRETLSATGDALGAALPTEPNTTSEGQGVRVLWLAPDRWLAVAADQGHGVLAARVRDAVPAAAVNDVSNGRSVLRVSGPHLREVLAADCPLDLHPRVFSPGHCAQSLIGQFAVLLDCVGDDVIDVYVARGMALSFWDILAEAAAEVGYRVDAAIPG